MIEVRQLIVEGLTKSFDGTKALDGVSFILEPPGISAVIGPNGAGKTTLLNVVSGVIPPDAGSLLVNGTNITKFSTARIVSMGIARTFQELRLVKELSALDNILLALPSQRGLNLIRSFFGRPTSPMETADKDYARSLVRQLGFQEKLERPVSELSYGQQKLLSIACCIATQAQAIFLDEPVAGLDPAMANQVLGMLKELRKEGRLIVFIEHDLSAVRQIAESVILMSGGAVIARGTPREILDDSELMTVYVR
jgi:ABC-type branched-subunit amino acid transport system ATPase component